MLLCKTWALKGTLALGGKSEVTKMEGKRKSQSYAEGKKLCRNLIVDAEASGSPAQVGEGRKGSSCLPEDGPLWLGKLPLAVGL